MRRKGTRCWLGVALAAVLLTTNPAPAAAQWDGLLDFALNYLLPAADDLAKLIPGPDRKPSPRPVEQPAVVEPAKEACPAVSGDPDIKGTAESNPPQFQSCSPRVGLPR